MRFVVDIKLGNAEMRSGFDVAEALRGVAAKIDVSHEPLAGGNGRVMDANGNTVGVWEVRK